MAKKSGFKKEWLLIAGAGVAFYLAWENNILGIRDLIDGVGFELDSATANSGPQQQQQEQPSDWSYPYNYYTSKEGSQPQQTHYNWDPNLNYPYPPTTYPKTVAPTTLPAAFYKMAGTPNIMQIPGTTTIMSPPNALMPNPQLWVDKGGIVTPGTRIALPSEINYGPYQFKSPIFSNSRYPIIGTNIDYPFLVGPVGPAPCPIGQYRAGDGRCYPLPSMPPEPCGTGYFRASDGRCYPLR